MILIALGANLPSETWGPPRRTLEAALGALESRGVHIVKRSRFYESAPVPASDQPNFVNAVAAIDTDLPPEALLSLLHEVEHDFGRVRRLPLAARTLDLDLLAYGNRVLPEGNGKLILPHPRLHLRHFVLLPLMDIAPEWLHPVSGRSVIELLAALGENEDVRPLAGQGEAV